MFRSVVLGSNDIERSKQFYDAVMGVLGCPPAEPNWRGALAYRNKGAGLMITRPLNGEPACAANGGHHGAYSPVGHFETVAGEALTVTTGTGATTGIGIVYVEV